MLKYARNKLVNVAAKGDERLIVHGVLDDDIYSCEVDFDLRRADMRIVTIKGKWHRYTTPDCPRALDRIAPAEGRCIEDADFAHFINKEVGRKGCEHFASLIIECAAAAREAELILRWQKACESNPDLDLESFAAERAHAAEEAVAGGATALSDESGLARGAAALGAGQPMSARQSGDGFLVDLHVHSYPASACATDSVDAMIREAKRIGLDAVCITDHNHVWTQAQIEGLRAKHDFAVFRGNEITTDQGDMLVFGFYEDVQGVVSIEDLQREVAAAGGIIVAAHPFRGFRAFDTSQLGLTPKKAAERAVFGSVDALEVFNGKVTPAENDFARQVADDLGLPGTGGSDAHAAGEIGGYATEFDKALRHEKDLVEALRTGRCRAVAFRREPAAAG